MPGINIYEFFILVLLAVVLLGPERLPQYAQTLAGWVKKARGMAEDAKVRFKEETGTDFDDVDWQKYDPRQYDPRRIIREALAEDYDAAASEAKSLQKSVDPRQLFSGESSSGRSGQRRVLEAGAAGSSGARRLNQAETPRHESQRISQQPGGERSAQLGGPPERASSAQQEAPVQQDSANQLADQRWPGSQEAGQASVPGARSAAMAAGMAGAASTAAIVGEDEAEAGAGDSADVDPTDPLGTGPVPFDTDAT